MRALFLIIISGTIHGPIFIIQGRRYHVSALGREIPLNLTIHENHPGITIRRTREVPRPEPLSVSIAHGPYEGISELTRHQRSIEAVVERILTVPVRRQ